ncbi:MAG: MFS transporter [Sphingomonadaceae bacterium]|uniref:MFS transporter n=1 Tax=Thermaurantiacus sp. TaxID=2820283 RepID=UPI00298F376D|nr:MFS transporter [Thermaurantiacus sp.]MCS6986113.1 MFS transporter [Sphingomonadaceae bacterium]MDW8414671.1 MFS transporter [Thermaurantiacus sp.]
MNGAATAGTSRRALTFIVALVLIDTLSFGLVIPVLPAIVMELARVPLSEASAIGGWLVMAFALAQFLASPILGALSDRHGRRPILLVSAGGHAVAFLIAGLAPSLWVLLVGRVISGLTGASFSTAYAYIADVTPPERRAQNFGLVGVAFGLGFMLGPALGGLLGGIDHRLPFYAAAGVCLLNFALGWWALPESLGPHLRRPFDWARANPFAVFTRLKALGGPLALLAAVHFLWWFAIQAQHSIWPYYTQYRYGWTEQQVGLSLGLVGLLSVLVNGYLVRRAVKALGEARTLRVGLFMGATAMAAYALAGAPMLLLAGMLVGSLGGLAPSSLQALATSEAAANAQGELQGALNALTSIAIVVGPPLYSQLFAHSSGAEPWVAFPGLPFALAATLAATAFLLSLKVRPRDGGGATPAGQPLLEPLG